MGLSLKEYIPIAILIFIAVGMGAGIVLSSYMISPRFKSHAKDIPYESGFVPLRDARDKFNVRFCVVAILFLIFDVEVAFIFPWAIYYRWAISYYSLFLILGEMFLFVAILLFGLFYAWKRGGLDWE